MVRLPINNNLDEYSEHPKVKSCGAVVFHKFDEGIKYLVIKTHEKFGDNWDFPKGAIEDTETELQAAIREVYEETGLALNIIEGFKKEVNYLVKNGKIFKTSVYFLGESTDTDVTLDPREVEAYEWLDYEAAMKKFTYDMSRDVLKAAVEFMEKN